MSGSLLWAHLFCIRWLSMLNNKSRAKQIILGLCEQKTECNNLKLSWLLSQTFLAASKCVKNQSIRHNNSARKNKFCCVSLSLCLESQLAEDQERQRILLGSLWACCGASSQAPTLTRRSPLSEWLMSLFVNTFQVQSLGQKWCWWSATNSLACMTPLCAACLCVTFLFCQAKKLDGIESAKMTHENF